MKKKPINLTKAEWTKLGEEVAKRIVTRSEIGKGVDGDFHEYTASYRKNKQKGGNKTRGKNKGKPKYPRQKSFSATPDMTLSGDMLRDLQVRDVTKNSVSIGWEGAFAERVKHNESQGRVITSKSKPVAEIIRKFINRQVEKLTFKKAKKNYKRRQVVKVTL